MATAASTPSRSRLLALTKLQSTLFSTTFNPDRLRLGNKVLRARLKGPALAAYYPRRSATVPDMLRGFKQRFGLDGWNTEEEDRLEDLERTKLRGKGAPKKIRTKEAAAAGKMKKKKR
jgi:small subunit ribosomal protein S33